MKNFTFYLLALCFLPFTLNAQIQLPDSDFETNWKTQTENGMTIFDFKTEYFITLNRLRLLYNEQGPADITAERSANAQHGNWCIKLVSGIVPVGADVFLPGMVGTMNPGFVAEFLETGDYVTIFTDWEGNETPCALEGWYKYDPKNGDSALMDIAFYNKKQEVFIEKLIIKEKVDTWTHFSIEIPQQYREQYFEDISILFVASAGVNFDDLKACKGQKGSALYIDNINLVYGCPVGIKQNLFSSLKANVYPNPATNTVVNIELNEHFTGTVSIYTLTGSKVIEQQINGNQCQVDITTLSQGNYIYKLMNENTIFAQGKFVVTK